MSIHSQPENHFPHTLRRSSSGRWLAGVCCGVAARWNLPLSKVRLLFVLATVLGGVSLFLYAAFWLVLPSDNELDHSPLLLRGISSAALVSVAIVCLSLLAATAAATTLFGFGWAVAVVAAIFLFGVLIIWPKINKWWVLLPLVAMVIPTVAVAVSGKRIAAQSGVVIRRPMIASDIPQSGYRMGLGDLLVDLRQFHETADATIPLTIHAGTGDTVVALPRDRCFNLSVDYKTHPSFGQFVQRHPWLTFYGDTQSQSQGHWERLSNDSKAPTLKIDFTALTGSLWIRDYPSSVGPLYDRSWPDSVVQPPSPGDLRWAWREEVRRPAVKRRWRKWRKQVARFQRRLDVLDHGACARGGKAHE